MDIKGIRTLNLVGTILFGLFGVLTPIAYMGYLFFGFWMFFEDQFGLLCLTIIVCWIIFVLFITYMLYQNTVVAIDKRKFQLAKRWVLYGAIAGFFLGGGVSVGIITLIIFLISYVSFDDALRPRIYYPPPGYPYPPPPGYGPAGQPPAYGPYGQPPAYSPSLQQNVPLGKNKCPKCGRMVEENWKHCPNCNEDLK
jgi:hypothetical protein